MEDLIERLQNEAGITEDQAIKAVAIVKDFIEKDGIKIDWENFFKAHYEKYIQKSKDFMHQIKSKTDSFSNQIENKLDDFTDKAKSTARDLSKKVYDKLSEEDEK